MKINEKAAYIKGLADGLKLNSDNPSDKLIIDIIDLLKDVCGILTDVDEDLNLAFDELEEINDRLDLDDDDDDYDDDDDDDEDEDDEGLYELKCPKCEETIYLSFSEISNGDISCPACGEHLDIDICDDDECCCEDSEKTGQ